MITTESASIHSITRLNSKCVLLLLQDNGKEHFVYRFDSTNRCEYLGKTRSCFFYDYSADEDVYSYCAIDNNSISLLSAPIKEGYNARQTISIATIMYHYFSTPEDMENGGFNTSNSGTIFVDEIENDLKYFSSHNIKTILCSELIGYINGLIDLPEKCVLITVDDGHYSTYKYLYPLLKKYNCCANVSVIGERIEYSTRFRGDVCNDYCSADYWLTWEEIAEMSQSGFVEFGSHSFYMHNNNGGRKGTQMKPGETDSEYKSALINDMEPLNDLLKRYCGSQPAFFAYPYNQPQWQYYGFMTTALGYELLFSGDSHVYSPVNSNCYAKGIGLDKLDNRLLRRFARHTGDKIEELINGIWNNTL